MSDNDWLDVTLGDFVTLQRGHDLPDRDRQPGSIPILGSFGVTGYHDRARAPGPGVTVGRSGASFGIVSYSEVPFWPLNTALYVRDFHGNDERFAYYFLQCLDFKRFNSGSAQPSLNRNFIHPIEIKVPPVPEQRAIASILGALDDKIGLNRKMSATLEAIARALFKSWFVDFDPVRAKTEGRDPGLPAEITALFPDSFEETAHGQVPSAWAIRSLENVIVDVVGGDWGTDVCTSKTSEKCFCIRGTDLPTIAMGDRGKTPTRFLAATSLSKRRLVPYDIVLEISGGTATQSTGRSALISSAVLTQFSAPLVYSNFCRVIRTREIKMAPYVYSWLRFMYACDEFFQFENGTSGIKNLDLKGMSRSLLFAEPPKPLLLRFSEMFRMIHDRIILSGSTSDTLASLRDALLPKLISGELRVGEAERVLAASA